MQRAAGKTGTTQSNTDAWFVGFTPYLTTAVWMGIPSGSVPMGNFGGYSQIFGGTIPALIWHGFNEAYHQDREPRRLPHLRPTRPRPAPGAGRGPARPAGLVLLVERRGLLQPLRRAGRHQRRQPDPRRRRHLDEGARRPPAPPPTTASPPTTAGQTGGGNFGGNGNGQNANG